MKLDDFIKRVDELIALGEASLKSATDSELTGFKSIEPNVFERFRTASLSFLLMCFGRNHPYFDEFYNLVTGSIPYSSVLDGVGILQSARDEMVGGWLQSTKGIVSAEVFADFLEMAEYLLSEGYKDAAAVMVGSVLEEHLRQLCIKAGIDIHKLKADGSREPKRANSLNDELAKQGVYNALDQKSVTAWLDLRNKAAHAEYTKYTKDQVDIMLRGVTDFAARITI